MTGIDPSEIAVIVIAKEPLAGFSKTRLTPPLAPAQAAGLAEAALADTLAAVAASGATRRVLALDGEPGVWLADGFELIDQGEGPLERRLSRSFDAVGGPALLVGMDTPQLTPAAIDRAVATLARDGVDAVLGPAPDGGYWSIGLRQADPAVFADVRMSTPSTAAAQTARIEELGLRLNLLETIRDFDTIDDARAVAGLCRGSRFARAFEALVWSAPA